MNTLRKNRTLSKKGKGSGIKFHRMCLAITKDLYAEMVDHEDRTGETVNWSKIAREAFRKYLSGETNG